MFSLVNYVCGVLDPMHEESFFLLGISSLPMIGPFVSACKASLLRDKIIFSSKEEIEQNYKKFEKFEKFSVTPFGTVIVSCVTGILVCSCLNVPSAVCLCAGHCFSLIATLPVWLDCYKDLYDNGNCSKLSVSHDFQT